MMRRVLIIALLFLAGRSWASVAVTSATLTGQGGAFSLDCGGGNLLVIEATNEAGTPPNANPTYGGASSVLITSATNAGGTWAALYYLQDPAAGSNAIAITYASGANMAGAVCFSGAAAELPIDGYGCATPSDGVLTLTQNVNVTGAGEYLVDVALNNNANAIAANATQTELWNSGPGSGGGGMTVGGSVKQAATAGVQVMRWTSNNFGQSVLCAASITQFVKAGSAITSGGTGSLRLAPGTGSLQIQ